MLINLLYWISISTCRGGVTVTFAYGYIGLFTAENDTLINIYPITANLEMIHYRSYQVDWNLPSCSFSMISISVILLKTIENKKELKKSSKKEINKTRKKGW